MLKPFVLMALILVVAVPIVAGQFLPWWGTLLVIAGEITLLLAFGPRLIAAGIKRYLLTLFKRKGEVLRNAQLTVHAISEVAAPEARDADEELRYLLIDMTIKPSAAEGPFNLWDPSDLLIVPESSRVALEKEPATEEIAADPTDIKLVAMDGSESESEKLSGTARLAHYLCIPQAAHRACQASLLLRGVWQFRDPPKAHLHVMASGVKPPV